MYHWEKSGYLEEIKRYFARKKTERNRDREKDRERVSQ